MNSFDEFSVVVQDIADLVSRQHYQIACQRYFEATHQTELDGGIQHPNQYFQESQKILNGDVKERSLAKGSHKVPTTRATLTVKEKPAVVDEMGSDDDYNYSTLDLWFSILRREREKCITINPDQYTPTEISIQSKENLFFYHHFA